MKGSTSLEKYLLKYAFIAQNRLQRSKIYVFSKNVRLRQAIIHVFTIGVLKFFVGGRLNGRFYTSFRIFLPLQQVSVHD